MNLAERQNKVRVRWFGGNPCTEVYVLTAKFVNTEQSTIFIEL